MTQVTENDVVIEPMPGPQRDFVLSEVPYPAFVGGVGSGKTMALMAKAMYRFQMATEPGMLGLYTLPTVGFMTKFVFLPSWRRLYRRFEGTLWTWREKDSAVEFSNGGMMFVRSAGEPEGIVGGEITVGFMDEAASEAVPDQNEVFLMMVERLRQQGFGPSQVCVATTPRQTRRWIIQRWRDGIDPLTNGRLEDPENYALFMASTDDNYHTSEEYKKRLAALFGDSRRGRQERGGEFLSVEGVMFDNVEKSFVDPHPDARFEKTVYGIDFGIREATAIIEWKRTESKRLWATDEFYMPGAKEEDWIKWLRDRGPIVVLCDPSASNDQIDYWRKVYGVPIRAASKARDWASRVNLWQGHLGRSIFISRKCPNLRNELPELAQYKSRTGIWEDKWIPGYADHAWDAGSYGLYGFQTYDVKPLTFRRTT